MEQNLVKTQIDEHLMTIQRITEDALERLERSGLKVDKKFLNYFSKLSIDRLTHTCKRYGEEAKYKNSWTVSTSSTSTLSVVNTTISLLGTEKSSDSMGNGDGSVKRQSEVVVNVGSELLKRQKTMKTSMDNDESGVVDQSQHLKYTIFYCAHCLNEETPIDSFNEFDDVYTHWFTHLDGFGDSKSFQFYAVALLSCFYCKEIRPYHDLVKHHQEKHADALFVITDGMNAKKCGMCHFKDGDLVEHFKQKHDLNSTPKLFNPIYYSEERIAKLLSINVTKIYACGKCNEIIRTPNAIAQHSLDLHNGEAVELKEIDDNHTTPYHFICDNCHDMVDATRYIDHLSEHTFNFRCTVCPYQSGDLSEIAFHEKIVHDFDSLSYHCMTFPVWMKKKLLGTNVVYANGLVLKAYNLLETKFDNSDRLDMFIRSYLDGKKKQAKRLINTHGMHNNP
ncbi:uncharacterized protein LOC129569811 [Sitodiplosis mosellana]|uniref:uncharacterized protein LOC129569811 n=1 Tax=Sitodiplosis mosellana TaxID=263140 RepID=UPI00244513FF|nr:uncharacterized protein LOC129569811 [Sitodiplosis mosellana]